MLQVRYNLLRPKDADMRKSRLVQYRSTKSHAQGPRRKRRRMERSFQPPVKTSSLQCSESDSPALVKFFSQDVNSTGEFLEHDEGLFHGFEKPSESVDNDLAFLSSMSDGIFNPSGKSCPGDSETSLIDEPPYEPLPMYEPIDNINEGALKGTEVVAWAAHDTKTPDALNSNIEFDYTGQADRALRSTVPLNSSNPFWNGRFSIDGLFRPFNEIPSEPYPNRPIEFRFEVPSENSWIQKIPVAPEYCEEDFQPAPFHADPLFDKPRVESPSKEATFRCPSFEPGLISQPSQITSGFSRTFGDSQFEFSDITNASHKPPGHFDDFPPADAWTPTQGKSAFDSESMLSESKGGCEQHTASRVAEPSSIDTSEQESEFSNLLSADMALRSRRASSVSFRSSYSGISSAINRLSGYSASHKAQMIYMIKAFSRSSFSISTKRSSIYSKLSGKDTHLPRKDSPYTILTNNTTMDFHLAELPSDFIISEVNTFATHIDCVLKGAPELKPEFCKGCCLKPNGVLGNRLQSVPYALMRYKRSCPRFRPRFALDTFRPEIDLAEDWGSKRPDWIDRFGNSTLHIAAALGATFRDLSSLVNRGADVNRVNTAGETFMHTLYPWEFSSGTPSISISTFLENLVSHSFDFGRRDDRGQTFLHVLSLKYKVNLVHLLEWLPLLCQRDNQGSLIDYKVAYTVVDSTSQFSKQRIDLQSFTKSFNKAHQSNDSEFRSHTDQYTFQDLAKFRSSSGMNGLHILAVRPYPATNHIAIKSLVSCDIDIDAYDVEGETPLMKCVQRTCGEIAAAYEATLSALLDNGASVARRNRDFETALHMAVKAGNIIATKALLKRHANVHARDQHGRGAIAVAEAEQRRSIDDVGLYAKIAACIALVIDAGAVRAPNLFDEWSLPEGKTSSRPAVYKYSQALPVVEEDSCHAKTTPIAFEDPISFFESIVG